jgi:hypothetical protein
MRAKEPESVLNIFYSKDIADKNNQNLSLNYCPSFNNSLNNVYAIRSLYDYEFKIENSSVTTNLYNQEFFDDHVLIRSIEKKFFTFYNQYVFFTEEETLDMYAYQYPFFEENNITERCIIIPGKFDIGKWFRPLEFPFILKNNFNEFKVENDEILYYIKFDTNKKIKFTQFKYTEKIDSLIMDDTQMSSGLKPRLKPISWWYENFKLKNHVLKEIKNNIL